MTDKPFIVDSDTPLADAPKTMRVEGGYMRIALRPPKDGDRGYIGAQTSYEPRPGETWRRGNDHADGDWSEATVDRICADLKAIIRGERT